ncbi:hypothetical protein HNQ41_003061 [Texcoconibacillus texcoconensis]|uniref:Uncharacterized protein n=1 Tax=Texcoconibacillus texcoconensis TaxID=1095777 RepID=A0A840QU71_9BACI|nr:hypothetical protein [Texcoconibacillus texcoconensis]
MEKNVSLVKIDHVYRASKITYNSSRDMHSVSLKRGSYSP